jgi:hypothetical protein
MNYEILSLETAKKIGSSNKIIKDLEKYLLIESEKLHNISGDNFTTVGNYVYLDVLNKLKELKEKYDWK